MRQELHLLIPHTKAAFLIAVAKNNDAHTTQGEEHAEGSAGRREATDDGGGVSGWCRAARFTIRPWPSCAWGEPGKLYKASLV
jgi:hypothetical protein